VRRRSGRVAAPWSTPQVPPARPDRPEAGVDDAIPTPVARASRRSDGAAAPLIAFARHAHRPPGTMPAPGWQAPADPGGPAEATGARHR